MKKIPQFSIFNFQFLILIFVLSLALALGVANLLFGDLNHDEGWYLYAAQNVARGNVPYRDFFFTQGSVMPYFYAVFSKLWSPFGVIGGRVFTLLLGFLGAFLASWLAAKNFPRGQRLAPWIITFALTACSVYHSYFTTIPKTYALSSLLLILACLLLSRLQSRAAVFFAGLLFALATATRVSMGAGALAAGIWLLFQHRRMPWQWLLFATGGIIGLLACFGPFWLVARDQWVFANTFHAERDGGGVMFIVGSAARLVRGYFPLSIACVLAVFLEVRNRIPSTALGGPRQPSMAIDNYRNISLWLSVAFAILLLQLLSPFPYDDYQVPVMPLIAAAAATSLCKTINNEQLTINNKKTLSLVHCSLLISILAALHAISSPNVQSWFFIRQDRFWPVMKSEPDVLKLTRVARSIPPGFLLLTQDAYLAVAGQHRLPQGFEMGPFGYFTNMSDNWAERYHVLNKNRLREIIATTDAPYAMLSGYAFALQAPAMTRLPDADRAEIFSLIAERYDLLETIEDFGQYHTPLTIWKLKQP